VSESLTACVRSLHAIALDFARAGDDAPQVAAMVIAAATAAYVGRCFTV